MALGAPIVATSQSLTGTPLRDGEHLLRADSDDEMVDRVVQLLEDPERCRALSRAARGHVEAEYSWEAVVARYEPLWSRRERVH
jgi:glycosyltransferase involved in cell wall biosynthesis